MLVMDSLEILLATSGVEACGNTNVATVKKFIKPRDSEIFGHPEYYLDGLGPSIAISGPHEFFSTVILVYG